MDEQEHGLEIEPRLSDDARREGLTSVVAPGLRFTGSLRHDHLSHRIMALISLGGIAVFVMVCALTVLSGG